MAVSSGAFMLVSMTGVGVAADRAIPGEFLYPLDRALEALGVSSDLVEERLQEAIALLERGEMALAIATSNEALAELGRSGVTATLPPVTIANDVTADTVEEISTTTTEDEIVEVAPDPAEGDEPSTSSGTVVEAAAEPVDATESLRLAAQQLLQSVRSAKTDPSTTDNVTIAALFLAEATASVSGTDDPTAETTTESTTWTSSTTSTSTTTTTVPEDPRPGGGNGRDEDSGTTSTTVASDSDDGSDDSTGDGEDDSPGPIFLPSP